MGIGGGIFLMTIGAILAFAVRVSGSSWIDLNTVGWILMVVGALGIGVSLLFWNSWGGFGPARRQHTIVERPESPVYDGWEVH
jgi:hypothetical protein